MADYNNPMAGFYTPLTFGGYQAPTPQAKAISDAADMVGTGTDLGDMSWMDSFKNMLGGLTSKKMADGSTDMGWGSLGLNAASGLMQSWLGAQQLGVAKQTLAQNKAQYEQNYAAQAKTTNAALSDRQSSRVAANPNAYQSVGDYMKTYGI